MAPQTESIYFPHVFTKEEIHEILAAGLNHQGRNIWSGMLYLLILILYCTGLRFGEAVRLQVNDVDLSQSLFYIRESKGRSRLVPYGDDLKLEIDRYLAQRAEIINATCRSENSAFFVKKDGKALTPKAGSEAVRRLLRKLKLKPEQGRLGPRPYDIHRHAYAVHRVANWYREGVDIHAKLPWLSAYMGHVNVLGTEVYLHATPELLHLASDRLRNHLSMKG